MQERILTPSQVAQILQIHQFTVLKYIKQGKIKASKIGRVYRIRESDLENFLDQSSSSVTKKVEAGDNEISKSKNKNKKTKKIKKPVKSSDREISDKNEKDEDSIEKETDEVELTISRIETIETTSQASPKHGGDDEYYILR